MGTCSWKNSDLVSFRHLTDDFDPVLQAQEAQLIMEGSDGNKTGISVLPWTSSLPPWGICTSCETSSEMIRPSLPLLCIFRNPRRPDASLVWQLWLCFYPGKQLLHGSSSTFPLLCSNQTDRITRQPSSLLCLPLVPSSRLGVSSVPYLDEIRLFLLFFLLLPKVTDCSAEIINILSKRNPNISSQNSAFSGAGCVDAKTNLRGKWQRGKKTEK